MMINHTNVCKNQLHTTYLIQSHTFNQMKVSTMFKIPGALSVTIADLFNFIKND